jgi:hypothetical protein
VTFSSVYNIRPASGEANTGSVALVLVALLAMVLAGCAGSMHWERPGTDQATAQADMRECRAIARHQHRRLTERPLFLPYVYGVRDKRGRIRNVPTIPWQQFGPPVWWPCAPGLAIDQVTLQHELYEDCLEAKGYARVPESDQADVQG